jgi:ABC-2 type transport system permease protein
MRAIRQSTPSSMTAFKALVRSDFLVQLRQRRAFIASLLVPLLFLFVMKRMIPMLGQAAVLATCISIGLPAIGLMGYALVVARDRELGVFQRLRATPCPTWVIMSSRFAVQLLVMAAVAAIAIAVANFVDDIQTEPGRILLVLVAVLISGALFLALGQLVVALLKSSEAVNAATRLIYMLIVVGGIFGQSQRPSSPWHRIVEWSPLGVTKTTVQMALASGTIGWHGAEAVLASLAYTLVFAAIGIHWFKWTVN